MAGLLRSRPSLSAPDGPIRRVASASFHRELLDCREPSLRARRHLVLQVNQIAVSQVRSHHRSEPVLLAGSAWQRLAARWGLQPVPRGTPLSLNGGRSGWRLPEHSVFGPHMLPFPAIRTSTLCDQRRQHCGHEPNVAQMRLPHHSLPPVQLPDWCPPASALRISSSCSGELCGIGARAKPPSRPWSLSAAFTFAGRFG